MMSDQDYICEKHANLRTEMQLSPPKYNCKQCKEQLVHGYTNPNHGSNPFGYLYLVPNMCVECSVKTQKCMWCD
jgi:hypothetical protein